MFTLASCGLLVHWADPMATCVECGTEVVQDGGSHSSRGLMCANCAQVEDDLAAAPLPAGSLPRTRFPAWVSIVLVAIGVVAPFALGWWWGFNAFLGSLVGIPCMLYLLASWFSSGQGPEKRGTGPLSRR